MKNIAEIKKILSAFYVGETSKEEEMYLADYFQQKDLPEEMQEEKVLFLAMYQTTDTEIPEGLEDRLSALIDKLEKVENSNRKKNKKRWMEIGGIAASICLLVSIGLFWMNQSSEINSSKSRIEHPETRLTPEDRAKIREAQKALEMVSTNFNKGINSVEQASENL